MNPGDMDRRALSLVELIVAVVILGVLAAIAIPRFSQGATNGCEPELRANLTVLRTAINLYYQDHGAYPGQNAAGLPTAGPGTPAAFILQLTRYTDSAGRVSSAGSDVFCYGPYLRWGIPPCPVSSQVRTARLHMIGGAALPGRHGTAREGGWIYNYETGYIAANSDGVDADGVRYDAY